MSTSLDQNAIEQVTALAVANAKLPGTDVPIAVIPAGYKVEALESFNKTRTFFNRMYATHLIPDFVRYVDQYADKTDKPQCFVSHVNFSAYLAFDKGTPEKPLSASHSTTLTLEKTAEYTALNNIVNVQLTQRELADFIEDFTPNIRAFHNNEELDLGKAVAAVRAITIESAQSQTSVIGDMSSSGSLLEQVEARAAQHVLPTSFEFDCTPYHGLCGHVARLRVSVLTGGDKPRLKLRIMSEGQYRETIVNNFTDILNEKLSNTVDVFIGNV